jgi:ferrochelatase
MQDSSHLPPEHPEMPSPKVGVLIANLGTPDATDYWSMRRFLSEFLSDRRVIDYPAWKWQPILQGIILSKRPFTSGAAYDSVWNHEAGESPLMTATKAQVAKLRAVLEPRYGGRIVIDYCMRYGNPSTASRVREMVANGCDRVLFVPLYPQYSATTTATANDELFRALMKERWQPAVRTAPAYFDRPSYIEALAQSVEHVYAALEVQPDLLLATYHGMPVRYLKEGDPYHCQCQKTSRLLRERLGWTEGKVVTAFQSVFGR